MTEFLRPGFVPAALPSIPFDGGPPEFKFAAYDFKPAYVCGPVVHGSVA